MNLGENIYFYRTKNNMSQGDLAASLEVSRQSVSKWENNSAVPELDKLIKMSILFDVTLDGLVYARRKETPTESRASNHSDSMRITLGLIFLVFGMVFFLLSIFWGDKLVFGEAFGEIVSISIVLFSISLLATDNAKILAACAVIYFIYSIVCFGILDVTSITNYLFLFLCGSVILVWFIVWGTRATAREKCTAQKER